jgi:hypothetical protein
VREYRKVLLQIIVEQPLSAERSCSWSSVPLFAYGPFCEDTSGSRCDAAPGVASGVVSRRVLSASGSSANISSHIVVPSGVSFARLVVCQAIYRSLGRAVPSASYRFRPRNYGKLQGHAVTSSQRNRTVPQVERALIRGDNRHGIKISRHFLLQHCVIWKRLEFPASQVCYFLYVDNLLILCN